jgi:hypothetical protein
VGGTTSDCSNKGDQVCDTPPVSAASFGCQEGKNSCTVDVPDLPDMIKNYMDYSDGNCMNLFTTGQKARIASSMYFRQGIFGGTPNYVQNITYAGLNTDGTYIDFPAAKVKAPYSCGFEAAKDTAGWVVNNFNNVTNGWQMNLTTAYNGSKSFYLHNFTNTTAMINGLNGFQAPEIDIRNMSQPTLEFYYAYAQKYGANNDSFTVRISNDFGMNETKLWSKGGVGLSTASGLITDEYIPTHQEWKKVSIDLSAYKTYDNARIRFEHYNRKGNNIYFDEFVLRDGPTGVEDQLKTEMKFTVYPNPMHQSATLTFSLKERTQMEIILVDIMGKATILTENQMLEPGNHSINLEKNNLSNGLYFIRVNAGVSGFTHKLLIN